MLRMKSVEEEKKRSASDQSKLKTSVDAEKTSLESLKWLLRVLDSKESRRRRSWLRERSWRSNKDFLKRPKREPKRKRKSAKRRNSVRWKSASNVRDLSVREWRKRRLSLLVSNKKPTKDSKTRKMSLRGSA